MKKQTAILFASLLFLISTNAFAGAILFSKKYVGKHPLSGRAVTIEMENEYVQPYLPNPLTLRSELPLVLLKDLNLQLLTRNAIEAVYEIMLNRSNGLEEKIVTTGDCQDVENFILIFPSGMQLKMERAPL